MQSDRAAGLVEGRFAHFHRLQLLPLAREQQEAVLRGRLGPQELSELLPYLEKLPAEAQPEASEADSSAAEVDASAATAQRSSAKDAVRVTANPLMLSMVASLFELRRGGDQQMPETVTELYGVAATAMLERAGSHHSSEMQLLLEVTFFEAHARQKRLIDVSHLEAAALEIADPAALSRIHAKIPIEHRRELWDKEYAEARRMQRWTAQQAQPGEVRAALEALHTESIGVVCARVGQDRLPLLSLLEAVPLSVQSSHLSFQEYFTAKAICEGRRLPQDALPWKWSAWWANVLRFGHEIDGLMTAEQRKALRLNSEGFACGLHKAAGLRYNLELRGQLLSARRKAANLLGYQREQIPTSFAAVTNLITRGGNAYNKVDLSDNCLIAVEALHLASQMRREQCPVAAVDLSSNILEPAGASAIAGLISTLPRLVDLNLANCTIAFSSRRDEASRTFDGSAVLQLATGLVQSSLTSLDLGSNELCDVDDLDPQQTYATECFDRLVAALAESSVTSLSLRHNGIGDRGATAIGAVLHRSRLRRLNLWGNRIGESGAQSLAEAIPGSKLVDLNLCGMWLRLTELTGIEPVARLDFTNKAIRAPSLAVVTKGIQHNRWLRSLTLCKLWLADAGAAAIAVAVPGCPLLDEIDLGVNCITSIGATAMAAALPRCSRLTALDLCHNLIDDLGVASLCEQLPRSPLRRLVISSNQVDAAPHMTAIIAAGLLESKLELLKCAERRRRTLAGPCSHMLAHLLAHARTPARTCSHMLAHLLAHLLAHARTPARTLARTCSHTCSHMLAHTGWSIIHTSAHACTCFLLRTLTLGWRTHGATPLHMCMLTFFSWQISFCTCMCSLSPLSMRGTPLRRLCSRVARAQSLGQFDRCGWQGGARRSSRPRPVGRGANRHREPETYIHVARGLLRQGR